MGKRERAGIFLFASETRALAIRVFLRVSDGERTPALGARACGTGKPGFVGGELFLSDFQLNSRQILTPWGC